MVGDNVSTTLIKTHSESHAVNLVRYLDPRGKVRELILDSYFAQYNGNVAALFKGIVNNKVGHWKRLGNKWISPLAEAVYSTSKSDVSKVLKNTSYVNIAVPKD